MKVGIPIKGIALYAIALDSEEFNILLHLAHRVQAETLSQKETLMLREWAKESIEAVRQQHA